MKLLLGTALAAALVLPDPAMAQAPVVTAPAGTLRGAAVDGVNSFKGIPYALPPVGRRRWRAPVAMPAWKGERDATRFGAACIQPQARGTGIYNEVLPAMSEDCLSLNIWTPANAARAPVFVWIHGGALATGASSLSMYDGAALAKRGVIVVSINYRLGVLGYLAHPELSKESGQDVSGNYGLLDQVAALEWVKKNIGAFGGDAGNVTVAGESAGALSVMYLLASPRAKGLFAKAIAQSAYMISTPQLRTSPHGDVPAEGVGYWLMGKLGAENIAAMRGIDAEALTAAAVAAGYSPWGTVDGKILPRQLVDTFDRGEQAKVPLLTGFNSGEIRSLRILMPPVPADAATYEKAIRDRYGDLAEDFLKLYPSANLTESMLATPRDALYGWTSERMVRKQAAAGVPSYLYYFDHGYPAADSAGLHGFHASEIPYMFGTLDRTPQYWPKVPDTAAERQLSDAMVDYWTSFAKTGVPAAAGQSAWPAYGETRAYMYFAGAPRAATHLLPGMYELSEKVMCRRRAKGGIAWNWNFGVIAPVLPEAGAACR
ncbi:carboxylesterase family protein [Sphingomonas sp. G-3-2-10]|uniref:carboxylesterase/lipase family protein n=1 Tax=Sphingomonas sp. G-3-2-10 TaxID=2728838 RepID=UPI00146C5256|nr:carboxylesterase family protein [Sphingomonas sp. G-3-2-10]NML08250.1 carboxylesterase family protein [Sphingomonas sp. G-3-2-10]